VYVFIKTWKPISVSLLFLLSSYLSYSSRRYKPGEIFFSFSLIGALVGVISSEILFYSIINRATVTLFSLYVFLTASIKAGVISYLMSVMQKMFRGKPSMFYLFSTVLASFFPFQRQVDVLIKHLKHRISLYKTAMYPVFPALFAAASSLTIVGSIANLLADHLCNVVFEGTHWGFFSNGPISLTLFFICFFFFWIGIKAQKNQEGILVFAGLSQDPLHFDPEIDHHHKVDRKTLDVFQAFDENIPLEPSYPKHSYDNDKQNTGFVKKWMVFNFLLFLFLSIIGISVFYSAPICGILSLIPKSLSIKEDFKCFPLDTFLLLSASLIFSYLFLHSGLAELLSKRLVFLEGKISVVTFFLFLSSVLSMFIPSLIAVAVLVTLINFLPICHDPSFLQVVAAAITFGSFLILNSRAHVRRASHSEFMEDSAKTRVRASWTLSVYLAFVAHVFLFYRVD